MATTTKKSAVKKPATKKAAKKPAVKKAETRKADVQEPKKEKFSPFMLVRDRIEQELRDYSEGKTKLLPWQKPWGLGSADVALRGSTGKPYGFVNQMMLDRPGEWYTLNQIQKRNARIKKGAKAGYIVEQWWKEDEKAEADPKTGKKPMYPVTRYFRVFHVDDIDGIEPRKKKEHPVPDVTLTPDEKAEGVKDGYIITSGVKLKIRESNSAYYRPSTDEIVVPELKQYKSISEYYSTMFHEMAHSTGHVSRLNRIKTTSFANHEYSKEELVAEICAAALVNHCGLETTHSFKNSVAYVENWINALHKDMRMAFDAARAAEKAYKMIIGEEEKESEVPEEAA